MKLLLITLFVGFAAAAKLTGTYLPPSRASTSGGHGGFLQGPHATGVVAFGQSAFGGGAGRGVGAGAFGSHGAGAFGSQGAGAFGSHGSGAFGSHGAGAFGSHGAGAFGTSTSGAFGSHGALGGGAHSGAYIPPAAHGGQYQNRAPSGPPIPIIKYDNVNNGDGTYHFEYQTANGITQQEQGHLVNAGGQEAEQVVQGTYSYTGDDGRTYTVHYKADGNGFQAVGDHLPTPPPIPEAIQKSLAYNAAHAGQGDSGAYSYTPSRPQQSYLPPSHTGVGGDAGYHY